MARVTLTAICLTLICYSGFAKNNCSTGTKCFVAGEFVNYQVYYNMGLIWINAGSLNTRVGHALVDRKVMYQLILSGRTSESFDSFFTLRDTLISYVDTADLTPVSAFKSCHEGKWSGVDFFTFEPRNNGWSITTSLKRKGKWGERINYFTENCGFDMVTSFFRLRTSINYETLRVGDKYTIPIRLDDGEYNVYLTYKGKQTIKLHGNGNYKSRLFELTLIQSKQFKRGDVMKLWVSDDEAKVPLLVESPIAIGAIKAVYKSSKNIRNMQPAF